MSQVSVDSHPGHHHIPKKKKQIKTQRTHTHTMSNIEEKKHDVGFESQCLQ